MTIKLFLQNNDVLLWNSTDSVTLRDDWRIVGTLVGCLPRLPRQNNHLGLPLQLLPEETTLLLEKEVCVLVKPENVLYSPTTVQIEEHKKLREKLYEDQIELFKAERKKEMTQNLHLIREGKKKKLQQDLDRKRESGEIIQDMEVEVDVDSIDIPPVPIKNSMVQLYTESPYNEPLLECSSQWNYPVTEKEGIRYRVFKDLWEQGYFLTSGSKFGGDFLVYPGDPAMFHSFYIAVCRPHNKDLSMSDFISLGRMGSNVRKTVVLCSVDDQGQVIYTSIQWTGIS